MSFILADIVSAIYDSYEALPGGRTPIPRDEDGLPMFGNLEKAKNGAVGKVIWTLQSGTFGAPALTAVKGDGADDEALVRASYQALARFLVWMWVPDLQTGWEQMVDLIAAIRNTVYGPNLGLQNFTIPTELEGREMHGGTEVYVLDLTLSVPIPAVGSVPETLIILESHEGTLNTGASSLEDFTSFDTVVVTGPPTP